MVEQAFALIENRDPVRASGQLNLYLRGQLLTALFIIMVHLERIYIYVRSLAFLKASDWVT